MFRPVFNVEDIVLLHHFFLNFEKNQARANALYDAPIAFPFDQRH